CRFRRRRATQRQAPTRPCRRRTANRQVLEMAGKARIANARAENSAFEILELTSAAENQETFLRARHVVGAAAPKIPSRKLRAEDRLDVGEAARQAFGRLGLAKTLGERDRVIQELLGIAVVGRHR